MESVDESSVYCKGQQPDNPKEAACEGMVEKCACCKRTVPGKVSLSPTYRAVTVSSSCNFHFIYSGVLRCSPGYPKT